MTQHDLINMRITTRVEAESFLKALHELDLVFHLEDSAVDCLSEVVSVDVARAIDKQVELCYEVWSSTDAMRDCPIGYLLKLIEK